MEPASVHITRYDCWLIRPDHLCAGIKALLDALKVRTTGRRDGLSLYYFGAIRDDGPGFVDVAYSQKPVADPSQARLEIQISSIGRKATGA